MEEQFWFETPTMVRCYEHMEEDADGVKEPQFFVGIAYHDEVICACCGGVYDLEDLYDGADEDGFSGQVVTLLGDWVDFSDYIQ